jgi:glycosyltransferase involved in cell wall biosynthesis
MRVLYVTYRESLLGGASLGVVQTQVRDVLAALATLAEVRWLALVGAEATGDETQDVHRLPTERPLAARADALRAIRRAARDFRPDVIHARSYNAAVLAALARTGVPVVFDPRSLMPDERVEYKGSGERSLRTRAWRLAERLLVRHTAATVGVSAPMTAYLGRHARGMARPPVLETVPLAMDPRRLAAASGDRDDVRRGLGLTDRDLLVVYTGSLTAAGPVYLAAHLRRVAAGTPDAAFLVLTRDDPTLLAGVERLQVRSATYDEVPGYLAAADWGVVARRPARIQALNDVDLTTKFVEYLGAGLPVLVARTSTGLARLVEEHDLGLAVEPRTDEPIALARRADRPARAAYAASEYDVERVAAAYLRVYERVARRG